VNYKSILLFNQGDFPNHFIAYFLNRLVSDGWALRNAQVCANICISTKGKIYTKVNDRFFILNKMGIYLQTNLLFIYLQAKFSESKDNDCVLKEFKPTYGSEVFFRHEVSFTIDLFINEMNRTGLGCTGKLKFDMKINCVPTN